MSTTSYFLEVLEAGKVFKSAGWLSRRTVVALRDVTFRLCRGDSIGIIGPSASGKTTLVRLLSGGIEPTTGRIMYDATDLSRADRKTRRRIGRRLGFVYQSAHDSVDPLATVLAIIAEPITYHLRPTEQERVERVVSLLEMVGLPDGYARRYPHQLSRGELQRVCIARAIAMEPHLVVMDEPTIGLDVPSQKRLVELVADLQQSLGFALVCVSHNLAVSAALCRKVLIVEGGSVVEAGLTADVLTNPKAECTVRLLRAASHLGLRC